MYVKLNCKITVTTKEGKIISFTSLNDCVITKSIDKLFTTCKIKLPTSARLKSIAGNSNIDTAAAFEKGDKINIQLGYNERLNEEFEGFIDKINLTTPLEIECEGYEYHLRSSLSPKIFSNTTLKDVLQYVLSGVNEVYLNTADIPYLPLDSFIIKSNLPKIEALQQLKNNYGLTIYFIKDVLYAGLDFITYLGDVKYSLGRNTPKVNELKYQKAEDVKIKVKVVSFMKNNKKIESEFGDSNGELKTLTVLNVSDPVVLKKLAEVEAENWKYDGFAGKLTSMLEPYSAPGMVAKIVDVKYTERSGNYEIRSVTTSFGTSGAKRTVEIGKAVSL